MHTATFQLLLCYNFMLITAYLNFSHLSCYNLMLFDLYRNFSTFSYVITTSWSMPGYRNFSIFSFTSYVVS